MRGLASESRLSDISLFHVLAHQDRTAYKDYIYYEAIKLGHTLEALGTNVEGDQLNDIERAKKLP